MGGFGWHNPMPCEIGGGPTDIELIWQALRDAVGKGGPGPEDSIEDLWRQARARVIAFSSCGMERAALQVFPNIATDWLAYYEKLLGIFPPVGATETERREEAARRFAIELRSDGPSLLAALQEIEPDTELVAVDPDLTIVAQFGVAYNARPYTNPFGSNNASDFPAFSTDEVVTVRVTLEPGETQIAPLTILRMEETLNELLPAWVDFAVTQVDSTGTLGFWLDGAFGSLLDLTAFD
jgi:hypothetical protein